MAYAMQCAHLNGLAKSSMVLPNRMPVVCDTTPEPNTVLICVWGTKVAREGSREEGVRPVCMG